MKNFAAEKLGKVFVPPTTQDLEGVIIKVEPKHELVGENITFYNGTFMPPPSKKPQ